MTDCTCDMHMKPGYHCRRCCLTFGGLTAFDRHLDVKGGGHKHPLSVGLVNSTRGLWSLPYFATPSASDGIAA